MNFEYNPKDDQEADREEYEKWEAEQQMTRLPDASDNPNGLHRKYIVTNANGKPVDEDAIFFVLRIDNKAKDRGHVIASRRAATVWCDYILRILDSEHAEHLRQTAEDLMSLIRKLEQEEDNQ